MKKRESESHLSGGQFTEDQPASVPRDTMLKETHSEERDISGAMKEKPVLEKPPQQSPLTKHKGSGQQKTRQDYSTGPAWQVYFILLC